MNAIRQTVTSVARAITICLMLSVPMAVLWEGMEPPAQIATNEQLLETRGHAPGSAHAVTKRAGCREALKGDDISGVVIDPAGKRSWTYTESQTAIAHAFEQKVYDGVLEANEWTKPVDHGMRVAIFCK